MKRKNDALRKVTIKKDYQKYALGSCLISFENTKVLCSVNIDEKVPPFLKGKGTGWLTAEYGMLPGSCNQRIMRDSSKGKVNGRTMEIQRLIGRSLRAIVDLEKLGERTIWIDCDVIQGDGGTRTASITGAYVALAIAIKKLLTKKVITENPLLDSVAAISVGIVEGEYCLDLEYIQDSNAEVDMNVVMTGKGNLIEVQGTAEKKVFSEDDLAKMLKLAKKGIRELKEIQKKAIGK